MSKITFRADEALVEEVERLDASKSEVMRDALRAYLDGETEPPADDGSVHDVNVRITVETPDEVDASATTGDDRARSRPEAEGRTCSQCGTSVSPDHVFCPNCGEKASHRFFCDCGDEIRSDWAYCPSCGRRTPSADVLDR